LDALCKLILELYRAAKETPVDEFQDLALALVKAQIPFRAATWGAGEMTRKGLTVHGVHLHNEPLERLTTWTSINHSDTVIDAVVVNAGRALIIHTPSWFSTPDTRAMLDYTRQFGHLNSIVITSISKDRPYGQWLSLFRPDKHDHFCQADSRVLEQIMPHLIEALEINRLLGQVPSAHADFGMTGARAIARPDGTLYHCGKKFAELVLEIWPERESGRLPAELMAAVCPNKEAILAKHALAVSTSTLGNMLFLNIRRVSLLHRLSHRELEVARLYGQGRQHKEIGLALNISPYTVRNFLARIYTKLGIDNKVDLVFLLSNE
jgi:DNA-binding CsgD family transcriptional regulator